MSNLPYHLVEPTVDEVRAVAEVHGLSLSDEDVRAYQKRIRDSLEYYRTVREYRGSDTDAPADAERVPGYRPDAEEDPLNAFVRKCSVHSANDGPLSGVSVGLKDVIPVAGIQMCLGSTAFEGYVPHTDATVVSRLLEAGAEITAKLNLEDLAMAASGEVSSNGPVLNPADDDYLAGGSSSGSAAAVATGDVDVALGTDAGGSIRVPSSWCGVVGLKPTFSLVPYTGIASLGRTFDHVGPIASSVRDCARMLDAIAGDDGRDPRQGHVPVEDYSLSGDIAPADLTLGRLTEGFETPESDEAVDETVRTALNRLEDAGCEVVDVSVPMHEDAIDIARVVQMEGITATVNGDGVGFHGEGWYDEQFADVFGTRRRTRSDEFPPTLKLTLLVGQYVQDNYTNRYYAMAQNAVRELRALYDSALDDVDALVLPTTPKTAHEVESDRTPMAMIDRAFDMIGNTSPFNMTGHPAISLPAGTAEGLPIGAMLVGRQFGDAALLEAAAAFERVVSEA